MDSQVTARHLSEARRTGPEGNEHLTALTGTILLVGFAIEGATILEIHRLLWLHFAVGFALCVPVALKTGSTLYRFARYYTGSALYVRRGPPAPLLRALGPFVILTSVAVLGTGVLLGMAGPGNPNLLLLHKASFVLWFGVMTVHVVAYAPRLPRLLLRGRYRDRPSPSQPPRAASRYLVVALALAGAVLVGALTMHLSGQWTGGSGVH